MKYDVSILEPARVFLSSIHIKLRAKAFRTIELLQEFGPLLKEPHAKKIAGTKELFELRVKVSSNICRLFYFHYDNKIYVITSGYMKKEQKLNKLEIEKALKLMRQYKEE